MTRSIRKSLLITILIIGGTAVFLLAGFSQGYNTGWTHPTLAEKSARLFNQYDGGSLSEADIQQIVQGVINEDTPPRYINHFYDPTTGQGWTAERMGDWSVGTAKQLSSTIGLSPSDAVSAPNWAQNQELQSRYWMYEGNHTFQKAVYDYVNGDKSSAYRSLGHILHLIEDMTVPAHTREDSHVDVIGDPEPFEKWVEETKDSSPLNDLNPTQGNLHCQNLNDCFNQIAKYSNENFFSEDTIFDKSYPYRAPIREEIQPDRIIYYFSDLNGANYPIAVYRKDVGKYTLQYDSIRSAYWQRLSKKAVFGGAEIIRIFQEEVAKAEKDKSLLEKPPSAAMPIFSLFGTGVQISSRARGLWNNAVSKINSLSTFMSSLVGGNANVAQTLIDLPNGLTVNQAAIDQLSGANHKDNNESNSPQPSLTSRGGENEDGVPIVNIIPQNFPSTSSGQVHSVSSGDTLQPINIVPELPMVLGETTGNSNGNRAATTSEASAKTPVFNPTVLLGAGATPLAQPSVEEVVEQEQEPESPTASSTPEETASTTEEDLIPPETYATSTPFLVSNSTSSPQIIATSTIIFEFSSSEATSTFQCSLNNASSTVCVSPVEYNNLSDGEHSFEVKAIDQAGNADQTPITFNWTVNAAPPEIFLTLLNYQLTSFDFTVDWNSSSADVISYKIQCRSGEDRTWHDWFATTTLGQKFFRTYGDDTIYYFRGRATDNMGNQSVWQEIAAEISRYPVVINEIAWMGTGTSTVLNKDEWIELYNKTNQSIDLTGWTLRAIDGSPDIILATTTIPAHSFYLLEKTDDNTVFDIASDQIYTGDLLENNGEILELRDANGRLIDSTPSGDSWTAGSASSEEGYRTMERVNPYYIGTDSANWKTYYYGVDVSVAADGTTSIHGTPKAQNIWYDPGFFNLCLM